MIDFKETAAAFTALVAQLGYISRWHFVKAQKTEPAADVLFDNLAITFEQEGRREDLKKTDKITCQVTQIEPSYSDPESKFVWTDRVTIRIRNTQVNPTKKLYVTGIFMSELFEIDCETINENSIATPLDSGKDFFVYGGNKPSFRISFYKNILIDKWDKFNNFLKIYVSEEPFVITQFKQLGLEYPRKDVTIKSGEEATGNRGGDRDDSFQEPKPAPLQWAVRTIELEFDTTAIV